MRWTVFLFFLILTLNVDGQQKFPVTPGLDGNADTNYLKYGSKQLLSVYPFNEAKEVKIVSFGHKLDTVGGIIEKNYGLPILNDTISYNGLYQVKTLTKFQIDTLVDILYNSCSKVNPAIDESKGCWYPGIAVIFVDSNNVSFEYKEICFQCMGIAYSSDKIKRAELCLNGWADLENYINQLGIKTREIGVRR